METKKTCSCKSTCNCKIIKLQGWAEPKKAEPEKPVIPTGRMVGFQMNRMWSGNYCLTLGGR